jgi:hypothetical protein
MFFFNSLRRFSCVLDGETFPLQLISYITLAQVALLTRTCHDIQEVATVLCLQAKPCSLWPSGLGLYAPYSLEKWPI